ncbi:MAG: hypothetical protein WCD70_08850 [Alphaproteobacteria bacterium]
MKKFSKTINASIFIAVFIRCIAICLSPAQAQDQPSLSCDGSSALTQDEFLSMLHAIVEHDDLSDVPFIEKTLKTQLQHYSEKGGLVNYEGEHSYGGDSIHNGHATVYLSFYSVPRGSFPKPEGGGLGVMLDRFPSNPHSPSFHDCGYLTKQQLDQSWGGGFIESPNNGKSPIPYNNNRFLACKTLPVSDQARSLPMRLMYGYDKDNKNVDEIDIDQSPHDHAWDWCN